MSSPDLSGPGILRTLHVFGSANHRTLRMLRRECDLATVSPGQVIHPQGRLHWAYGILSGAVTVVTGPPPAEPDEHQLWIAGAGDTVGMQEAVLGIQPVMTIQALLCTEVAILSQRAVLAAMESAPGLALAVARRLIGSHDSHAET